MMATTARTQSAAPRVTQKLTVELVGGERHTTTLLTPVEIANAAEEAALNRVSVLRSDIVHSANALSAYATNNRPSRAMAEALRSRIAQLMTMAEGLAVQVELADRLMQFARELRGTAVPEAEAQPEPAQFTGAEEVDW